MKEIGIDMTVFQMIETYPETKELLIELGLTGIENPLMLRTAGKKMTLKKGAQLKKIKWENVVALFLEHGFEFKEGIVSE